MWTRNELAAFGAIAVGVALLVVAGNEIWVEGIVARALAGVGLLVMIAAALWHDVLDARSPGDLDVSRREILLRLLLVGGVFLVLWAPIVRDVSETMRVGLGIVGVVLVLALGYWRRSRTMDREYDEREVRIRYRAAYDAFLVVNGLVFAGMFAAYLASAPYDEGGAYGVSAVLLFAGLALAVVGGLTFKLSEGWYRTRM